MTFNCHLNMTKTAGLITLVSHYTQDNTEE